MSLVHHTARTSAIGLLLSSVLLAGCSGSDEGDPARTGVRLNAPINLANCSDWRAAAVRERRETIWALRDFAGGPAGPSGGHGAVLDDDKAYDLFESYCSNHFARHFKLYKLYTRAASFGAR